MGELRFKRLNNIQQIVRNRDGINTKEYLVQKRWSLTTVRTAQVVWDFAWVKAEKEELYPHISDESVNCFPIPYTKQVAQGRGDSWWHVPLSSVRQVPRPGKGTD